MEIRLHSQHTVHVKPNSWKERGMRERDGIREEFLFIPWIDLILANRVRWDSCFACVLSPLLTERRNLQSRQFPSHSRRCVVSCVSLLWREKRCVLCVRYFISMYSFRYIHSANEWEEREIDFWVVLWVKRLLNLYAFFFLFNHDDDGIQIHEEDLIFYNKR